jgi:hypothetical protein
MRNGCKFAPVNRSISNPSKTKAMKKQPIFEAVYEGRTSQYATRQYAFAQRLIHNFEDFTAFLKDAQLDVPADRAQRVFDKIVSGTVYKYEGKPSGEVCVGGSCNPNITFRMSAEALSTYYIRTRSGNIVAMVNGVETFIDPRTHASNAVEKPCFRSLSQIERLNHVHGYDVTAILDHINAEKAIATKHRQAEIERLTTPRKGWYVVTLEALVSRIKGNDGKQTYSYRILATSEQDAFDKACEMLRNNMPDNVTFIYEITDNASSAFIEYVGVWTDQAELEYH